MRQKHLVKRGSQNTIQNSQKWDAKKALYIVNSGMHMVSYPDSFLFSKSVEGKSLFQKQTNHIVFLASQLLIFLVEEAQLCDLLRTRGHQQARLHYEEDPFARSWPPSRRWLRRRSKRLRGLIIKQHVLKFVLHVTPLFNITKITRPHAFMHEQPAAKTKLICCH